MLAIAMLSSCSANPTAGIDPEKLPSTGLLADVALRRSGCEEPNGLSRIEAGDPDLETYVGTIYGIEDWTDATILHAQGVSAFEIAIVRCTDAKAATSAASSLKLYASGREGDFAGYAPAESYMAANAVASQSGPFAALFVCPDPDAAKSAFGAALQDAVNEINSSVNITDEPKMDATWPDRIAFSRPGKDDMSLYDTTAMLDAWGKADPATLSRHDAATYKAAESILDGILADGMSDYEKEQAIYGWMVSNVDYDWSHKDPTAYTPRISYEPYGALVERTAVCLGYATAFQLLADMAGIESMTVVGAAFGSSEDHAWNQVQINGEWHCVDVTWDANQRQNGCTDGTSKAWEYFNVSSGYMAETDHQWDYASVPEAIEGLRMD